MSAREVPLLLALLVGLATRALPRNWTKSAAEASQGVHRHALAGMLVLDGVAMGAFVPRPY